jgi:hypothetical protein
MRDRTTSMIRRETSIEEFERWTEGLWWATYARIDKHKAAMLTSPEAAKLYNYYKTAIDACKGARTELIAAVKYSPAWNLVEPKLVPFLKALNSLPSNVPDEGPHTTINVPVGERRHLQVDTKEGSLTPASLAAAAMTPDRVSPVAVTEDEQYLIMPNGQFYLIADLPVDQQALILDHLAPVKGINK